MKPDLRIFRRDETEYWSEDVRRRAGRLTCLYVFDANRHVNACEFTPSFEMWRMGTTWSASGLDDDDHESLYLDVSRGDFEGGSPVAYFHVRGIDVEACERIEITDEEWAGYLEDADGDAEEAYLAVIDKSIERCEANGYVY